MNKTAPYNPAPTLYGRVKGRSGSTLVFGYAIDIDSTLVALSIMGGSTITDSIIASIRGNNYLNIFKGDTEAFDSIQPRGKYKVVRKIVPDTNYISSIITRDVLDYDEDPRGHHMLYLPGGDHEEFLTRFHHRLTQICRVPVLKPWMQYIYETEANKKMGRNIGKCIGHEFDLWWMRNNGSAFEQVIRNGLKEKKIHLSEDE